MVRVADAGRLRRFLETSSGRILGPDIEPDEVLPGLSAELHHAARFLRRQHSDSTSAQVLCRVPRPLLELGAACIELIVDAFDAITVDAPAREQSTTPRSLATSEEVLLATMVLLEELLVRYSLETLLEVAASAAEATKADAPCEILRWQLFAAAMCTDIVALFVQWLELRAASL